MKNYILLPLSTNRTVSGPVFNIDRDSIVVAYDYENDDGTIDWVKITFTEMLSFEFRNGSVNSVEDIDEYESISYTTKSELLDKLIERWNIDVGWHDWQKEKGGSARFKHFHIYFDDAGAIDVVASACEIGEKK